MNIRAVFHVVSLWLLGLGLACAQSNSIEAFSVSQQGGKVIVRIQTKTPLPAVPPSFTVANPARIAIDFPGTANALGRASQDIGEGELRSMNLVQGAEKARMVLNLRRPVTHEMSIDGNTLVVTLSQAVATPTAGSGAQKIGRAHV